MEQKTAQFLVLFNHFYPLASKNPCVVKTIFFTVKISLLGKNENIRRNDHE